MCCIHFCIFLVYTKYYEMAIAMACLDCYGILNLLVTLMILECLSLSDVFKKTWTKLSQNYATISTRFDKLT